MAQNQTRQGSDVRVRVGITIEDVAKGVKKKIRYKCIIPCMKCNGTGKTDKSVENICPHCNGTGKTVKRQMNGMMRSQMMLNGSKNTKKKLEKKLPNMMNILNVLNEY